MNSENLKQTILAKAFGGEWDLLKLNWSDGKATLMNQRLSLLQKSNRSGKMLKVAIVAADQRRRKPDNL